MESVMKDEIVQGALIEIKEHRPLLINSSLPRHIMERYHKTPSAGHPGLAPIPTEKNTRPFSTITMDFITGPPKIEGYDVILVIVNHDLTKGVILHPCTKEINVMGMAAILYERVCSKFGILDVIISNRGPQFTSKAFRVLTKLLKIKAKLGTAYHP